METSGHKQVTRDITEFMSINDIDLTNLMSLKGDNLKNPFLSYLNINSLRYKIVDLRHILEQTGIEIVAVSETKLSEEFPDSQFFIDGYTFPAYRRDRNSYGGGLIVFTRKDLITKRIIELESTEIEVICLELTIAKRKWAIFSVYRPPRSVNLASFFSELNKCVDMATRTYENIVVMGDINIDTDDDKAIGQNKLSEFCDVFGLENLIQGSTCVTVRHEPTSIDVILTNKKRSFKNSGTVATGLSDYHKMVLTTMRANYERLKPTKIQYRSYKNFSEKDFLRDLQNMPFHTCMDMDDNEAAYSSFKDMFKKVVDKHAPMKSKLIRGTHAPFMNKELSKAIMHRSRLKNIHNKTQTKESWEAFKRQRNKCVAIKRKNVRTYFSHLADNNGLNNKKFWSAVKPFLTDKSTKRSQEIILNSDDKIVKDSREVTEILNNYFTDIIEITTGKKPRILPCTQDGIVNDNILDEIIFRFKDHPSVKHNKSKIANGVGKFSFKPATAKNVERIIDKLEAKTSTGFDSIPPKLIKLGSKIISEPLSHLINETIINQSLFPQGEKIACITPVFKKEDRLDKKNYRPISVLNVFSKIFERFILDQLTPYFNNMLSDFLSAYRRNYSCQHVLLRMTEAWRKCLDDNKVVGTILMDLSKAFDCLPHDLLLAKLEAYGLESNALKLIMSYLSGRKQCVKNGGYLSQLKLILSGVPQGSILGPILFNIFINDIFLTLGSDLHNFANDNTVTAVAETIQALINSLEIKMSKAIQWMENNDMIANPEKFKSIVLTKHDEQTVGSEFNFSGITIYSSAEVDHLGVKLDTKLSFESHISKMCKKAAGQLNALKRLQGSVISYNTRKALAESFILSNFNYCPLVWYFSTQKQLQMMEKIQERVLRFLHNDYKSDYSMLLKISGSVSMEVKRMRYLCVEIYKTLNDLSPNYMKDIFQVQQSAYSSRRPHNILVPRVNQTKFGTRSIRCEGARIWNHLPDSIKSAENLRMFKTLIKTWKGPSCNCNFCQYLNKG